LEQVRGELEELSRDRTDAIDRKQEVERTNDGLKAKIAEVEDVLRQKQQLLSQPNKFDLHDELSKECAELSRTTEAELAKAQEASRESVEVEDRLISAERLLKERQAALAAETERRKGLLQAELAEERESMVRLENAHADLDARNRSLEGQLREIRVTQAELQEEMQRKESELELHQAVRSSGFSSLRTTVVGTWNPDTSVGKQDAENTPQAQVHRDREFPRLPAEAGKHEIPRSTPTLSSKRSEGMKRGSSAGSQRTSHASGTRSAERPGTAEGSKVRHRKGTLEAKLAALDRAIREKEDARAPVNLDQEFQDAGSKLRKQPPAPTATAEVSVTSSMRMKNLDYNQLTANPALLTTFQEAMKKAIASAAGPGILPEHVELALSAGSVVVLATIKPPRGVCAVAVQSELKPASLSHAVSVMVASLDSIKEVATGPITVSEVRVSAVEPAQSRASSKTSASPRKAPRSSYAAWDSRAQREKEARRARRALEDAIVLASRIQLLRAEGARTRRRIHQAQEKTEALSSAGPQMLAKTAQRFYAPSSRYPAGPQQPRDAGGPPMALPATSAAVTPRGQGPWFGTEGAAKATVAAAPEAGDEEAASDRAAKVAAQAELVAALAVRAKVALSKERMQKLNAAIKAEVQHDRELLFSLITQASAAAGGAVAA